MTNYWTFIYEGERFDAEFESRDEAYKHAEDIFIQQCEDDGLRENSTTKVAIIQFYTDDEGEMKVVKGEHTHLHYEYYQGDYAEHNVMHDLV